MTKTRILRTLSKRLSKVAFRISLPFVGVEVPLAEILNTTSIDERIAKLDTIKRDLQGAIEAVEGLQDEAQKRKGEVDDLQQTVERLREDKDTAQTILRLPEESVARLISRASSKGRIRGAIEGVIIGFLTGALSSFLVWYLTKGH